MKFHEICEKDNLTVCIKAFQTHRRICYKEMGMRVFITELFIMLKKKNPKYPISDELNKYATFM